MRFVCSDNLHEVREYYRHRRSQQEPRSIPPEMLTWAPLESGKGYQARGGHEGRRHDGGGHAGHKGTPARAQYQQRRARCGWQ